MLNHAAWSKIISIQWAKNHLRPRIIEKSLSSNKMKLWKGVCGSKVFDATLPKSRQIFFCLHSFVFCKSRFAFQMIRKVARLLFISKRFKKLWIFISDISNRFFDIFNQNKNGFYFNSDNFIGFLLCGVFSLPSWTRKIENCLPGKRRQDRLDLMPGDSNRMVVGSNTGASSNNHSFAIKIC